MKYQCVNKNNTPLNTFFRIIFYILLIIIIINFLWRHSTFYYKTPFFVPFAYRLNKTCVTLKPNEKYRIYIVNINKKVSYRTSNFRVAKVSQNGVVHAKKKGKAIIRVKVDKKIIKCKVIVK